MGRNPARALHAIFVALLTILLLQTAGPALAADPADAADQAPRGRLPAPPPAPRVGPGGGTRPLPTVAPAPGYRPPAAPGGRVGGAAGQPAAALRSSGRPSPSLGLSGPQKVGRYRDLILRSAQAAGADAATVAALMEVENSGEGSISPAGAMGLMQLMPDKFRAGDDPYDPATNLLRAAQHVRLLQDRWRSPEQVAAAYFGALDRAGNVTGASDGGVNGHEYVARFRAAFQRHADAFRAVPPNQPALASLDLGQLLDLGGRVAPAEPMEAMSACDRTLGGSWRSRVVPLVLS